MDLPEINKYSLGFYKYHRCILIFLIHLVFFLDRDTLGKSMKISFTFLGAILDLICIYKVQAIFWKCLKWLKWVLLQLNYAYTACYTEETHVRLTGGAMGPPVIHTGGRVVSPVTHR